MPGRRHSSIPSDPNWKSVEWRRAAWAFKRANRTCQVCRTGETLYVTGTIGEMKAVCEFCRMRDIRRDAADLPLFAMAGGVAA